MSVAYQKPLPVPDADSAPFWERCRAHELSVQACANCGLRRWPPGRFCPRCHATEADWVALSGAGTVVTYVVVHRAFDPAYAGEVPYVIAHVEPEDAPGMRLVTNLVDCDPAEVHVGLRVVVVFEDVTDEVTLPKFAPQAGAPARGA